VTRKNEVMVGIAILAGIVVTVMGTLWLQGSAIGRQVTHVEAVFEEVGQLTNGSAVKVRGVPIGRVREIRMDPSGQAVLVRMDLHGEVPLPAEAGVILAPESMFGDWQAEIVSRTLYPQFNFRSSSDPDILPGFSLPDMSRLTAAADQIAQNITSLTERVELAFTEETATNIRDAIQNIQEVSQSLAELVGQQGAAIQDVTAEVARTAEDVGRAARAAQAVFQDLEEILEGTDVEAMLSNANQATANLRILSEELGGTNDQVRAALARADSALASMGAMAARIDAGEGSLGRLLNDPTLADEAEDAVAELVLLLQDFRENPQRYVRLSIF